MAFIDITFSFQRCNGAELNQSCAILFSIICFWSIIIYIYIRVVGFMPKYYQYTLCYGYKYSIVVTFSLTCRWQQTYYCYKAVMYKYEHSTMKDNHVWKCKSPLPSIFNSLDGLFTGNQYSSTRTLNKAIFWKKNLVKQAKVVKLVLFSWFWKGLGALFS